MDKKIIQAGRDEDKLTKFGLKLFSQIKTYWKCHPGEDVKALVLLRDKEGGSSFLVGITDDQVSYEALTREFFECASLNNEMAKLLKTIIQNLFNLN